MINGGYLCLLNRIEIPLLNSMNELLQENLISWLNCVRMILHIILISILNRSISVFEALITCYTRTYKSHRHQLVGLFCMQESRGLVAKDIFVWMKHAGKDGSLCRKIWKRV